MALSSTRSGALGKQAKGGGASLSQPTQQRRLSSDVRLRGSSTKTEAKLSAKDLETVDHEGIPDTRTDTKEEESEGAHELKARSSLLAPMEERPEFVVGEYKVGSWSQRNTYLPKLDWAEESPVLCERFKNLIEARDMNQIRILLHGGFPPNMRLYPVRRSALHRATELGDELLCQLLLSFKADPLCADDFRGFAGEKSHLTPLDIAERNQQLHLTHLFNAHLGNSHLIDVGPSAGRAREHPIRVPLKAYEPGFMSCRIGPRAASRLSAIDSRADSRLSR